MPSVGISEDGVRQLLLKTNPYKAAGPDEIPARIPREYRTEFPPLLTTLFRKIIQEGTAPDDWKRASVSAIFKGGDRNCAANYMPVSLTSLCGCQIQEHIISDGIMRQLSERKILVVILSF